MSADKYPSIYFRAKWRDRGKTETDIEGVGWDMSIPIKLFLFLETEVYFPRRPYDTFQVLIKAGLFESLLTLIQG